MHEIDSVRLGARLVDCLDLWAYGVELTELRLRREHPEATPEEIRRRVEAWLRDRPGAEHGDGAGRPAPLPK